MEDRQVSLKQVLDALHGYFDGMLETGTWSPCDVYGLIEMLPSAHPEIIRCKDCKRWDDSPSSTIAPMFHKCRGFKNHHTEATDFCSHAERREEGAE